MTTENKVQAVFCFKKETPGAVQLVEVTPKGQPPVSGSLYLKKYVAEQFATNLEDVKVRVTVEAI